MGTSHVKNFLEFLFAKHKSFSKDWNFLSYERFSTSRMKKN